MEQEVERLRTERDRILAIDKLMAKALLELLKVASTKETVITEAKIYEARIWLDKRQRRICAKLAEKTCE